MAKTKETLIAEIEALEVELAEGVVLEDMSVKELTALLKEHTEDAENEGETEDEDADEKADEETDEKTDEPKPKKGKKGEFTHIDRSNGTLLREKDLDKDKPWISPISRQATVEKLTDEERPAANK